MIDHTTYKRLVKAVDAACDAGFGSLVAKEGALQIYMVLTGENPKFDPGIVDRLKALNQQYSDEKNAAILKAKALEDQILTLRANENAVADERKQYATFARNRTDILEGLETLQAAGQTIRETTKTVRKALGA